MADRIRKINIDKNTVHAVVTTDGSVLPTTASIYGLACSAEGTLYAADIINHVVYKVFEDGRVKGSIVGKIGVPGDVVADGNAAVDGLPATVAAPVSASVPVSRLREPCGICVDASGNIYVSTAASRIYQGSVNKIYRISPSGRCQTLAGAITAGDVVNDNGLLCRFSSPTGLAVDKAGIVYVADRDNNKIKKVYPNGKTVVLAGAGDASSGMANGNGNNAKFDTPWDVCVDQNGMVYVADTNNYRIRQIDPAGNVVTLAGFADGSVDGVGNTARFGFVYNICIDASGVIWALDFGNKTIRRITNDGKVTTFLGWKDGTTNDASAIAVDKSGFLYILEKNVAL